MRTSRWLILGMGVVLLALVASGQMAARPALAVPANDNFANANAITSLVTDPVAAVADTTGATAEADEPSPCGGMASTVWYSWTTPPGDGFFAFDTLGSNHDTVLAVYTGNAVNALTLVHCNDDFASLQSGVGIYYDVAETTTYWIQVGGYFGATGNLVVNLSRGATMVVTASHDNVASDFALSLREAIAVATNPNFGVCPLTLDEFVFVLGCDVSGNQLADLIHFSSSSFPPTAPTTIPLNSSLPALSDNSDVISGIGAGVIVDGQDLGFSCLTVTGTDNRIQGLDVRRCARGILVDGGFGNLIGIDISNTPVLAQERNILRENGNGVRIANTGSINFVYGNYIGTDQFGDTGLGNGFGIAVESSAYQQIGLPGAGRNVISGNTGNGINLASSYYIGISGNHIGTNTAGDAALANGGHGVLVQDSSASPIAANVISGNGLVGIHILTVSPGFTEASDNIVVGNYVGTNAAGTAAIPNLGGIAIQNASRNTIGGTNPAQRNIISGNQGYGVQVAGLYATRNAILGNYVGTNAAGTAALPNTGNGVEVGLNATSNTIGGSAAGARNVISGNVDDGVALGDVVPGFEGGTSHYASTDVPKPITDFFETASTIVVPELATVTDINVTVDITHTWDGDLTIALQNPDGLTKSLSIRNGSSGDNYSGTIFDDDPGGYLPISAGSAPFPGIWYPDSPLSAFDGNITRGTWRLLVSDEAGGDIGTLNWWTLDFKTNGNEVAGNYIGTNAAGTQALGNSRGVLVSDSPFHTIGGDVVGARNVISGNANQGVQIIGGSATNNQVAGNYIGTDATGTVDLGNGTDGVNIDAASYNQVGGGTVHRNIISGNNNNGVLISGGTAVGNSVMSNYIGTNAAGTADLGNTSHGVYLEGTGANTIGAPIAAGNVISGNNQDGIRLLAVTTGSLIRANFIGTDATGTQAIANANSGIFILGGSSNTQVGGANQTERNVISGNVGHGINIQQPGTSFNYVQGNYIGTTVDGVTPLGNGAGIGISGGASNNRIGGALPGEGNTIAYNANRGIGLLSSGGFDPVQNEIERNSIFSNGGLGIDLDQDGVTPNDPGDPDTGPNRRQNYPDLWFGNYSFGAVNIWGSLNSTPSSALRIEFFVSADCDPSGHGEGATFVGAWDVSPDALGDVSFLASFPGNPLTGFLTATATEDDDPPETSEFSKCIPAQFDGDDDGDGFTNHAEAGHPLCFDGTNHDVFDDAILNDGCPGGPPQAGAYSEAQFRIGTGSTDPCGNNGWPSDLDDQPLSANELDIFDVTSYIAPTRLLDKSPGPGSPYNSRWDLVPGPNPPFANFINIIDLTTLLTGPAGSPAYPPMFGGLRAFGRVCPVAP